MTPSWKEIISKKCNCIAIVIVETFFLFMQMNCRIISFCKISHDVSFEAIETYLHENVYHHI